jgi:hypothetical protein
VPQEEAVAITVDEGSEEIQWPAVNRAYDFVMPSYQLVAGRFEAADTRLTTLVSLTSTLTLAAPIFGKNVQPNISFASPFFVAGMVIFLLSALTGILGRISGSLTLPDPMVLYNQSLEETEWEFKKNQIYFAGENFNSNVQAIRKKGNISICVTVALLLEVASFVAWLVL